MTELQTCRRVFAPSRRDQDLERKLVLPRLFALLRCRYHRCGFLGIRRVSVSSELKSFLPSICIDAPESTTNSRSSGDFEVCAGVALAARGEKNVALSVFLSLWTVFAKYYATLRTHLSWCKVSSCVLSSNLEAHGLRS